MNEFFYTLADVLRLLELSPTQFKRLRAAGHLPFLEPLRPRLGKQERYLRAPVDKYLRGQWGRSFFGVKRAG